MARKRKHKKSNEELSTCKAKVEKLNHEENVGEGVDRISFLPDEVMQHILSFLSTKEALRTSVLSNRWRSKWKLVTQLEFLEFGSNMSQQRSSFMDFVDRVIQLREPLDLQVFALVCEVLSDASRINSWVRNAVENKVRHLILILHQIHEEPFELPRCLFECDTIKTASIEADILLKLPSSIHFSNLKILTLKNIVFWDHHSTQRLFSGLPVLEELTLDSCCWLYVRAVTIALPKLQKLDVKEHVAESDNCQFFIIAANLKTFYYVGALYNDYCIYDSVSLSCASLSLHGKESIEESGRQREVAFRADRFLRGISCVKELMLTPYAVEVLTYVKDLYVCMPELSKLTSLGFLPPRTRIDFGNGTLSKFLHKTPGLELLIIQSVMCFSGLYEDGKRILDPVPPCFSSHLKLIKITHFCGTDRELKVVESLLKKAEILLTMYITCDDDQFRGKSTRKKSVCKKLKELPRVSNHCKIKFR